MSQQLKFSRRHRRQLKQQRLPTPAESARAAPSPSGDSGEGHKLRQVSDKPSAGAVETAEEIKTVGGKVRGKKMALEDF